LLFPQLNFLCRWKLCDPSRNWPDLGPRFRVGERAARSAARAETIAAEPIDVDPDEDKVNDDQRDLDWATVLKRTFEAYIRGERPNMYGEWIQW
jgi:WD repeat and SOF domain-containing protein 1